jgi:lipid A 3-O-deacylase
VSVRVQHVSNASIKKPNPGANFVRLRYLYRF